MRWVGTGVQNGSGSGGCAQRAQIRRSLKAGKGLRPNCERASVPIWHEFVNTCSYRKFRTNPVDSGIKNGNQPASLLRGPVRLAANADHAFGAVPGRYAERTTFFEEGVRASSVGGY